MAIVSWPWILCTSLHPVTVAHIPFLLFPRPIDGTAKALCFRVVRPSVRAYVMCTSLHVRSEAFPDWLTVVDF